MRGGTGNFPKRKNCCKELPSARASAGGSDLGLKTASFQNVPGDVGLAEGPRKTGLPGLVQEKRGKPQKGREANEARGERPTGEPPRGLTRKSFGDVQQGSRLKKVTQSRSEPEPGLHSKSSEIGERSGSVFRGSRSTIR